MGGNEFPHSIGVSIKARDSSESEAVISSKAFSLGRAQVALMCHRRPKEQAVNFPLATGVDLSWFAESFTAELLINHPAPYSYRVGFRTSESLVPPWGTSTQQSILIAQAHHRDWLGLIWPTKRMTSAHQSLPLPR